MLTSFSGAHVGCCWRKAKSEKTFTLKALDSSSSYRACIPFLYSFAFNAPLLGILSANPSRPPSAEASFHEGFALAGLFTGQSAPVMSGAMGFKG